MQLLAFIVYFFFALYAYALITTKIGAMFEKKEPPKPKPYTIEDWLCSKH